jgi:Uma2 family endonuclease
MATVAPRLLGPADHGERMSLEEFEQADVDPGYLYELARGVLEVSEVPDDNPHGALVCWFYRILGRFMDANPGRIERFGGGSEYRLVIPLLESGRHPDIAVTLKGTPKNVRGRRPPALAVEIVSPGREAHDRDSKVKREEYLAYGLAEYWVVDPVERRVVVLLRDGGAWVERVFTKPGESAVGLVLPGFMVPLAELWSVSGES